MNKKESPLLTAGQVSQILKISEATVKKLAKSGELPCKNAGRRLQFTADDLIRCFELLEGGAA